jgi:hypothetical protein
MKKYILTITFLVALLCHAQNLVTSGSLEANPQNYSTHSKSVKLIVKDSTKESKNKLFVLDSSKFRHSIDFRYIYDFTLGYNFSYHFLPKRLGVGMRLGAFYKKKESFPGGIYSRYGIKFSGDLYLDLTLWRSISLQAGVAFQNELTWPSKENPLNDSGKIADWGVNIYLKPTFIFYKHYLISAGVSYSSFQPYKYYEIRPVVSIGYKF